MTSVGVLLAAGGGSRFSGPQHKLLATLRVDGVDAPIWRHALRHLVDAHFDHVLVVDGAVPLDDVTASEADGTHVERLRNAAWADGQATSVHVALARAADLAAEHVTIGLADQPFVTAAAWRAVATAPPSPITIATYDGVPGPNPVRLRRDVWPLLPTAGDEGARSLLRGHPDWVQAVACIGSAADIDTLEDLDRWKS